MWGWEYFINNNHFNIPYLYKYNFSIYKKFKY